MKPHLLATVKTLLDKGVSQHEISRKTGIDRKTVRRYAAANDPERPEDEEDSNSPTPATGSTVALVETPPPWPPAPPERLPKHARSACDAHREWIEEQLRLGRNAMSIYQDLVEFYGFTHHYNSVKRFVRGLKKKDPVQYDRLEFLPGEEAQVDYGTGAPTLHESGKYRRPRLYVMTLKYSGRAFRKVVWKSSQEIWCRLHEEAFRYFGGAPEYVTLDNLKEGVLKPDIYDPELNPLYAAVLSAYDVTGDPARVGDPDRKGTVENGVKHTQNTALKGRKFESIEAQNDWLRHWEERWAAPRIHGRAKRQVEEMFQEEKAHLGSLPTAPFRYFRQEKRTVYDDGTIQADNSYYAAAPAPLGSQVVVRIYAEEIEILNPVRMEVIRRHPKSRRRGSLMMEPGDRIFNPSRETDRLLAQAETIGPETFALCEKWFQEEGRSGQRRMYGLINLVRRYPAGCVERAAALARANGLKSSKAVRRMVESLAAEAAEAGAVKPTSGLTQEHPLIRPAEDYGRFWQLHAAQGEPPFRPVPEKIPAHAETILSPEQLPRIWQQASWRRVIEVFGLETDPQRQRRDDEIWVKSPFTGEQKASMHVSLSQNVFKDFSSGKGGGIIQFCRQMLGLRGQEMTMLETAGWMVAQGISTPGPSASASVSVPAQGPLAAKARAAATSLNPAVPVDLRPYLRPDHPELRRRGLSAATCRYLGCGFLPSRPGATKDSPLNSRLVFQVRSLRENGQGLEPVIVSHAGRALQPEQESRDGKFWSYPFRKGWELYNQDLVLLDGEARRQVACFGLIVAEGFFDVAKLVEADCRNAVALMGSTISEEQAERLVWLRARVGFPRLVLFLDRDAAGQKGVGQVRERLRGQDLVVTGFDWEQKVSWDGREPEPFPDSIQDPADLSVEQLRALRRQGVL